MIQINTDNILNWEEIKEKHYEFVKKVVSEKINQIYRNTGKQLSKKAQKMKKKITKEDKEFLEDVLGFKFNKKLEFCDEEKLKTIAVGKLEEIREIFDKYTIDKKRKEILKYILDYEKTYQKNYRDTLLNSMDIEVCPYCNANILFDLNKKSNTGQIDHFYNKDQNPQYGLSLYNFIPSCSMCNTKIKGQKEVEGILYPYEESYEKYGAKFEIEPTAESIKGELGYKEYNKAGFKIKVKTENEKVRKTVELFRTEELYSSIPIKKKVENLREKMKMYSEEYVKMLNELNKEKGQTQFIFSRKQIILGSSYCNSEEEMLNKEYSKLKNDIYEKENKK